MRKKDTDKWCVMKKREEMDVTVAGCCHDAHYSMHHTAEDRKQTFSRINQTNEEKKKVNLRTCLKQRYLARGCLDRKWKEKEPQKKEMKTNRRIGGLESILVFVARAGARGAWKSEEVKLRGEEKNKSGELKRKRDVFKNNQNEMCKKKKIERNDWSD